MADSTTHIQGALLVVDAQNGALGNCEHAADVATRIAAMVERARATDVPVVWVQHESEEIVRDSDAWQIMSPLAPTASEHRVHKQVNDAFGDTDLHAHLTHLGVSHLVVCGAATDWCVRSTCFGAINHGYDVTLVEDAHSTMTESFDDVELPAALIVAEANRNWCWLEVAGVSTGIAPHDRVRFDALPGTYDA